MDLAPHESIAHPKSDARKMFLIVCESMRCVVKATLGECFGDETMFEDEENQIMASTSTGLLSIRSPSLSAHVENVL